jgi:Na+/H+ antiporter NhaD/arsenite permease-like protein
VNIPTFTLLVVFLMIAVRQIGRIRLQIWQIMSAGALFVLVMGQISPKDALAAINMDVMIFLFSMFVIGQALEESGYLAHVSYEYFKRARSVDGLLAMVIGGTALASALLMNDTLAVIGTPVMILLAKKHGMSSKLLLLSLMFAVTIGSVMSPIGNPQNLLIALNGRITNPFLVFLAWLFVPTVINIAILFGMLKLYYRGDFHEAELKHSQEPIHNHELAVLSRLSLRLLVLLILAKIVLGSLGIEAEFRLTHIAVAASLPVLVGSSRRLALLRKIDWPTLVFFAAMFVLMESVWRSGIVQHVLDNVEGSLSSGGVIIAISVALSQFISNVPMVALYQPLLLASGATVHQFMALAAGSTIAGNLTILGAASNVIVIQAAERRTGETVTFVEFLKVGLPMTVANSLVYWLFLQAMS